MANIALKRRVKAEAAEALQAGVIAAPANKIRPQGAAVPSSATAAGALERSMPSEHSLLQVPASKATLACFPPGCPVLYIDKDDDAMRVAVSIGNVESVFVDLTPGASLLYFYKISLGYEEKTIIARESQLQWAPHCPVWMRPLPQATPTADGASEWKSAVVSGSYQGTPDADPQYSVQEVGSGTAMFHGVAKDCLRFRPADDFDGRSSVSPTSIMDSTSTPALVPSFEANPRSQQPQVQTPAPYKKSDTPAPCVTESRRKRPAASMMESDEAEQHYPEMGRCNAEFTMPMWLKARCLHSEFVDQVCQGVEACTMCRATILEGSAASQFEDTKLAPLAGHASIFIYGREMEDVQKACDFVEDFLHEYFGDNTDDQDALADALSAGWTKKNHHDEKADSTLRGADAGLQTIETPSGLHHPDERPSKKPKIEICQTKDMERQKSVAVNGSSMDVEAAQYIQNEVTSSSLSTATNGHEETNANVAASIEETENLEGFHANNGRNVGFEGTQNEAMSSSSHSATSDNEEMNANAAALIEEKEYQEGFDASNGRHVGFEGTQNEEMSSPLSSATFSHDNANANAAASFEEKEQKRRFAANGRDVRFEGTQNEVSSPLSSATFGHDETNADASTSIEFEEEERQEGLSVNGRDMEVEGSRNEVVSSSLSTATTGHEETHASASTSIMENSDSVSVDVPSLESTTEVQEQEVPSRPRNVLHSPDGVQDVSFSEARATDAETAPSPGEITLPSVMARIIKVPRFANEKFIYAALFGEGERNREYLAAEAGCAIDVKFPGSYCGTSSLDPIEVTLTSENHDAECFDFAQRWVENRIVTTVPEDQYGKMLYYLAKDNEYGACDEGVARYQRSPYDLKSWVWMAVVEVPDGFERCTGLFIDKNGKAMKNIIHATGCDTIYLSETFPKHIFLCDSSAESNPDKVHDAVEAVKDRVIWALREYHQRNNKYRRW